MSERIRARATGTILFVILLATGMLALCRAEEPGTKSSTGPASQPAVLPTSLPDKFITTTGTIAPIGVQPDGVVPLSLRGRAKQDLRKITTNDKTVVVLLNGKNGKPGDLHPSQWVTVFQAADGGPALRIEPALSPAGERRVADLNGQIKSVTVEVNCSLRADPRALTLVFSVAEQKRAGKAHVVVLTEAEMDAVLRYFAMEGFLANARDFNKLGVGMPLQPAPSCMWTIRCAPPGDDKNAMNFIMHRAWDKDCIDRLDGLRSALPAGAIKELDWLVKNMSEKMPVPEVTP